MNKGILSLSRGNYMWMMNWAFKKKCNITDAEGMRKKLPLSRRKSLSTQTYIYAQYTFLVNVTLVNRQYTQSDCLIRVHWTPTIIWQIDKKRRILHSKKQEISISSIQYIEKTYSNLHASNIKSRIHTLQIKKMKLTRPEWSKW